MERLSRDESTPAEIGGALRVQVIAAEPQHGTQEISGSVVDVTPREPDGRVRVSLGAIGEVHLWLPTGYELPISIGEVISARSRSEVDRLRIVEHGLVVAADSELIVGTSASGDASFAPGWVVERGPIAVERPGSPDLAAAADIWVVLTTEGKTACVTRGEWRRIATRSGTALVSGEGVTWDPRLPLPADAASYHSFSVLSLRDGVIEPGTGVVDPFRDLDAAHGERSVQWHRTWSVFVPFQTSVGAEVWALRLNDFPAEPMFTLFVDGVAIGSLSDWPAAWRKPGVVGFFSRRRLVDWARRIAAEAREG